MGCGHDQLLVLEDFAYELSIDWICRQYPECSRSGGEGVVDLYVVLPSQSGQVEIVADARTGHDPRNSATARIVRTMRPAGASMIGGHDHERLIVKLQFSQLGQQTPNAFIGLAYRGKLLIGAPAAGVADVVDGREVDEHHVRRVLA